VIYEVDGRRAEQITKQQSEYIVLMIQRCDVDELWYAKTSTEGNSLKPLPPCQLITMLGSWPQTVAPQRLVAQQKQVLPTRPGLANTACLLRHGLPKRDPKPDSLRHTYIHARRLRASRSVAACGIDGQELAAHADRYLLASRFLVASITTAWLVAVVAVLQQGS
jgi:hypothetical protein